MSSRNAILILDWGIGGLSVYKEVRKQMPRTSIIYFSDAGAKPYGKMSSKQLQARLNQIVFHFARQGIRHIIIACNAASTALPSLQPEFKKQGLNVVGMIEQGLSLIKASKHRKIAVIGGRRTILSRSYQKPFSGTRKKIIQGRIAQPLSALIEKGVLSGPEMNNCLMKVLAPLRDSPALLLACTHYPAVAKNILRHMPQCELLDPAQATAKFVKQNWVLPAGQKTQTVFFTSGSKTQMKRSAKLAFGVGINKISLLPL
jgi:glutamate racemase